MNRLGKVATVFFLSCAFSFFLLYADVGDLKYRLAAIDQQRDGKDTQTVELERNCLELLEEFTTREDSGMIYAQIALIYAQGGMTQPDKTASYCEIALRYPLKASMEAQMFVFWADALQVKHIESSGDEFTVARREIVNVCLNGLKRILSHKPPKSRQTLPVVHRFDYGGPKDDPAYQELLRRNKEEMAQRKKIIEQNTLVMHREALLEKCIYLYSLEPQATDEFERLAGEIFGDEDAVKELISRIER